MKRFLILLLTILLCGCAANEQPIQTGDGFSVIATIFPAYDFAREIAGDKANVTQLLPPGAESHTYEPAPQDIIAIQQSDLFIYTGGEGDVWIDDILESMGDKAPQTLKMMDHVQLLEAEGGIHDDHHHHPGDGHHHDFDEHVWTSPKNAVKIAEAIAQKLCEMDAENAESYNARFEAYSKKLGELDKKLTQTVEAAKRRTILVGDRFPFLYLAEHYGIDYHAAFSACGSEGDASAATVAHLADTVKQQQLPAVLHIEFSNKSVAAAIAETAGVEMKQLHSCHNVTKEEVKSGASYLSLMEQNIETLNQVLN